MNSEELFLWAADKIPPPKDEKRAKRRIRAGMLAGAVMVGVGIGTLVSNAEPINETRALPVDDIVAGNRIAELSNNDVLGVTLALAGTGLTVSGLRMKKRTNRGQAQGGEDE